MNFLSPLSRILLVYASMLDYVSMFIPLPMLPMLPMLPVAQSPTGRLHRGLTAPTLRGFVGAGEHHAVPLRCCGTHLSQLMELFEVSH